MSKFEHLNNEKKRQEYLDNIAQSAERAIETMRASDIFDESYLADTRIVFFSNSRENVVYSKGEASYDPEGKFNDVRGFVMGVRTDFVALEPKDEYGMEQMLERQRIQELFYKDVIPYDEFLPHELAHNVFDRAYIEAFGNYEIFGEQDFAPNETKGLMTECSREYRDKIVSELKKLFREYDIDLDASLFFGDDQNNRQKIAEIFALLVQREFSNRTGQQYFSEHKRVEGRVREFLVDPEKSIQAYNQQTGRNITLRDFYRENHVLSFIVAPLLEKKFESFKDRINFFRVNTKGLLKI